jgi:hypothetical protein
LIGPHGDRHRDEPPEVTLGVDVLAVGAEEVPLVPVFPVFPVVPVSPVDPVDVEPVVPDEEDVVALPEFADEWPAPECSPATTTPMNAVAPVAAMTLARVRVRSRDWARSLRSGVLGWWGRAMGIVRPRLSERPYPNMRNSAESHDPLWVC